MGYQQNLMSKEVYNLNFFWLLLFALSIFCCGCNVAASKQDNQQSAEALKNVEPQVTPEAHEIIDPTCCGLLTRNTKGIDEAWRLFTQDGHYRLSLQKNMKFSEAAKNDIANREGRSGWNPMNQVFAYSWGHLGYDTDQDHLAAIIVDNTRSDDSRFGLVIFSKPEDGKYKTYWLYRNRDLSRTIVYQISGSLGILEYQNDGTYKGCWVEWNARHNQYICRKWCHPQAI